LNNREGKNKKSVKKMSERLLRITRKTEQGEDSGCRKNDDEPQEPPLLQHTDQLPPAGGES